MRKWQNYFKVNKPYQGIMANNKKRTRELKKTKLHGFSLQANYTDRATTACQRS
jgi:hypothetical protein